MGTKSTHTSVRLGFYPFYLSTKWLKIVVQVQEERACERCHW